jgi:hypothetical protein
MQKSDEARDFGDPASPLTIIVGTILVAIVQVRVTTEKESA